MAGASRKSTSSMTFWIGLITVGLSVVAFSTPVFTALNAEAEKEKSYLFALSEEMIYNKIHAKNVIEQYKGARKVSLLPTYSTTAYEAVLSAGMLNATNDPTPVNLIDLYHFIYQWQVMLDTANAQQNSEEKNRIITLHAKSVETRIDDVEKVYGSNQETRHQAEIYRLISIAGLVICVLALAGSAIEFYLSRSRPGLVSRFMAFIRSKLR